MAVGSVLAFVQSVFGYGVTSTRRYRLLPWLNALVCATLVVLSVWLIPRAGLVGAAWAICVGYGVGLLGNFTLLWFIMKDRARREPGESV